MDSIVSVMVGSRLYDVVLTFDHRGIAAVQPLHPSAPDTAETAETARPHRIRPTRQRPVPVHAAA